MGKAMCVLAILMFALETSAPAQNDDSSASAQKSSALSKGIDYVFNYLNMAGTTKSNDFRPLTQEERTHLYPKTMANPLGYMKAGFSAGIDQWKDGSAQESVKVHNWRGFPKSEFLGI